MRLKVAKAEHNRLIAHAVELVKKRLEAKWDICKIALRVCYIQDKGGKLPKDAYTITKFAEDIGMNRKTLSCWLLDYQGVYQKIHLDDSKMSYAEKVKLNGAIARTRKALYKFNKGKTEQMRKVPSKVVKDKFNEVLNTCPISKRLDDFIKNLTHHEYTFSHEKFTSKHEQKILQYREILKRIEQKSDYIIRGMK